MIRRPPRSTRTDTLFPYTTLFRSQSRAEVVEARLKAATSSWVPGKARSAARRIFRGRVREGYNLEQISRVAGCQWFDQDWYLRSEEHTSELQSLMRISYAVFCLKKKNEY